MEKKNKKDNGYIYVCRQEYIQAGIYKIGKTVNNISTCKNYQRQGNINYTSIYIPDNLSYAETLILNIFGPYRTVRNDNIHLSEQVHLPLKLIVCIIEWIIKYINTNGKKYDMKLSRSINTVHKYRSNIHKNIWNDLCRYIDDKFPHFMLIPMDTSNYETNEFLLSFTNFDQFIDSYTKNTTLNIYNEHIIK